MAVVLGGLAAAAGVGSLLLVERGARGPRDGEAEAGDVEDEGAWERFRDVPRGASRVALAGGTLGAVIEALARSEASAVVVAFAAGAAASVVAAGAARRAAALGRGRPPARR